MAEGDLSELEPLIVEEWQIRPAGKRTERDVFAFYGYLLKERAHLLKFSASRDKYSVVKEIVSRHLS
jgi:hypothetical protein